MSAPVTEAHRKLVAAIIRDLSIDDGAQLIADSEAKAVEQANAQVESLLWAAKNAIPASEHPAEPTVQNWAWQIRNLGEDRRLVYADRDKLRAEVEHLRESEKAFCEDRNTQRTRAERAEAELATERARLDYLSTRGFEHRHHETGDHLGYEWTISSYSEPEDVTLRDAIDAEMREEAK